jgi:hypothetical protein
MAWGSCTFRTIGAVTNRTDCQDQDTNYPRWIVEAWERARNSAAKSSGIGRLVSTLER